MSETKKAIREGRLSLSMIILPEAECRSSGFLLFAVAWRKKLNMEAIDMPTKNIQFSMDALETLRTQTETHRRIIAQIQAECEHKWKVHSHYPKPYGDTSKVERWWVHLICTICDMPRTTREKQPVCAQCLLPLTKYTADDEAARKLIEEISALDKHPTDVYVFRCESCDVLYGFPMRVDKKKE